MKLRMPAAPFPRVGAAALAVALVTALLPSLLVSDALAAATRAVVTTTAYGVSGSVTDVAIASPWTAQRDVATVSSDPVIRYYAGRFYVVNRFGGDNIQVLDPQNNFATVLQFSVGPGSNPQDIAFASPTKAYVSRYDSTAVWIVNPQNGAHLGSIDLAPFADGDGNPEMARMVIAGRRLFVALQILDRNSYLPAGRGKVAVIDIDADTLVDADPQIPGKQPITLSAGNPTTTLEFNRADSKIYLGETGLYGVLDGGIESVDPLTLHAGGMVVSEDSLGGDLDGGLCLSGGTQGYAIVSDAQFNTSLVRFDLSTHGKLATVFAPPGYSLADVAADDEGQVWLLDRTGTAPGARVFDAASGVQKTAGPIDTGLPPSSIAFDYAATTGVSDALVSRSPLELRLEGNALTAGGVDFEIAGGTGPRQAWIADAAGRRVRELASAAAQDATRPTEHMRWDGRDSAGRATASGVYWIVARSGAEKRAVRVVRIR